MFITFSLNPILKNYLLLQVKWKSNLSLFLNKEAFRVLPLSYIFLYNKTNCTAFIWHIFVMFSHWERTDSFLSCYLSGLFNHILSFNSSNVHNAPPWKNCLYFFTFLGNTTRSFITFTDSSNDYMNFTGEEDEHVHILEVLLCK